MPESSSSTYEDQIDRCLPQTQCTLCTYPRCREYAQAIAAGQAEINQCPPGGEVTIAALAKLTGKPVVPLNEDHGITEPKSIAQIVEPQCIGCKLCIKACPVDCIVGSAKLMHTVIANDCTGCKLCVPVCPTDCIDMVSPELQSTVNEHPSPWPDFTDEQVARGRFNTEQTLARNDQREHIRINRKKAVLRKNMQKEILEAIRRKNASKS